jgi:hypothetical protein
MFSLRPCFTHPGSPARSTPASLDCLGSSVLRDVNATPLVLPGLAATSATSYWLGGAKEMAAINPILIIVNDRVLIPSSGSK